MSSTIAAYVSPRKGGEAHLVSTILEMDVIVSSKYCHTSLRCMSLFKVLLFLVFVSHPVSFSIMSDRSPESVCRRHQGSQGSDREDAGLDIEKESVGNEGDGDRDDNAQQEGDEELQEKQFKPVSFWDPALAHVRKEAMLKWLLTTVVLMAFILGVLSIYWAIFFHLPQNVQSLVVWVVDFDGIAPYDNAGHVPVVGPTIVRLAEQLRQQTGPPTGTLGYGSLPPSHFSNDPLQVRQGVYDWDAWAAIVINPNATAMLYSAILNGNTSYDPKGACQFIYQDSRDDTNYFDFILPSINALMTQATSMVGEQWARMVFENISDPTIQRGIQAAPQAISPAIGFSEYNLRPFYPYVVIPAVSIGLIYLIIISFFSFSFYLPIHFKFLKPQGHPPLHFWQLVMWRWTATITAYLFLSLAYSLISLAFQIDFSGGNSVTSQVWPTIATEGNPDGYGRATFLVYWMLNYWGMIALGLACENMAMLIGQPWTGLWLIFWVITNVSTAFYDIDIEPRFYYWGYAFPLHQGQSHVMFLAKGTNGMRSR